MLSENYGEPPCGVNIGCALGSQVYIIPLCSMCRSLIRVFFRGLFAVHVNMVMSTTPIVKRVNRALKRAVFTSLWFSSLSAFSQLGPSKQGGSPSSRTILLSGYYCALTVEVGRSSGYRIRSYFQPHGTSTFM
jgi:hypothetical protein